MAWFTGQLFLLLCVAFVLGLLAGYLWWSSGGRRGDGRDLDRDAVERDLQLLAEQRDAAKTRLQSVVGDIEERDEEIRRLRDAVDLRSQRVAALKTTISQLQEPGVDGEGRWQELAEELAAVRHELDATQSHRDALEADLVEERRARAQDAAEVATLRERAATLGVVESQAREREELARLAEARAATARERDEAARREIAQREAAQREAAELEVAQLEAARREAAERAAAERAAAERAAAEREAAEREAAEREAAERAAAEQAALERAREERAALARAEEARAARRRAEEEALRAREEEAARAREEDERRARAAAAARERAEALAALEADIEERRARLLEQQEAMSATSAELTRLRSQLGRAGEAEQVDRVIDLTAHEPVRRTPDHSDAVRPDARIREPAPYIADSGAFDVSVDEAVRVIPAGAPEWQQPWADLGGVVAGYNGSPADDPTDAQRATPTPPAPAAEDDLTRLVGLDEAAAVALARADIRTHLAVATADETTLRRALASAGVLPPPSIGTWSAQAGFLVRGDVEGFEALGERLAQRGERSLR